MTKPELFDVVELLQYLPAQNLQIGAQGAILDEYNGELYEIEFTNPEGETFALVTLPLDLFVVIWRSATQKWVPIGEKIEALVAGLPEETRVEIFNFARLIHGRKHSASTS